VTSFETASEEPLSGSARVETVGLCPGQSLLIKRHELALFWDKDWQSGLIACYSVMNLANLSPVSYRRLIVCYLQKKDICGLTLYA
jgi:hypothetical protein